MQFRAAKTANVIRLIRIKQRENKPDPYPFRNIREQLEDYFYQALEVELLFRLHPDDEDTIYQIVDLLVDTCSTKRKMLRIAGDDKPAEVVRSRLKKLNADHIRFVLGCLSETTVPVRNMKQYLLASLLYNAPTTMSLYYQNKTNHDFARGSPGGEVIEKAHLQTEQIQQLPIDELHPFVNHPFKVQDDEAMAETVESISQRGIPLPLIVRPRAEGGV